MAYVAITWSSIPNWIVFCFQQVTYECKEELYEFLMAQEVVFIKHSTPAESSGSLFERGNKGVFSNFMFDFKG